MNRLWEDVDFDFTCVRPGKTQKKSSRTLDWITDQGSACVERLA